MGGPTAVASAAGKQLDSMSDITRLTTRTIRILGQNPSSFTLNGTNTYLVTPPCDLNWPGRSTLLPAMLVDTGDARDDYAPFLEAVLRGNLRREDAQDTQPVCIGITDIIMTHWHHDHVGGMPYVLRMLEKLRRQDPRVPQPRIHKFAEPATDATFFDRIADVDPTAYAHAPNAEGARAVLWPLRDAQTISVVDPENSELVSSLRTLFTPGHAADHTSLLLEEDNILFTGDNVLGRGSTVFEDLVLYLRSLQRSLALLSARRPTMPGVYGTPVSGVQGENVLYPGHGPVVPKGRDTIRRYIRHRLEREEQILALLTGRPGDKAFSTEAMAFPEKILAARMHTREPRHTWTLFQMIAVLYANYETKMYPAVARGLLLHLQKLSQPIEDLPSPPFYLADPLPSTHWAKDDRLVRSMRLPSYQRSANGIPDAASNEAEWWELMDIPWVLSQ